MSKHIMMGLLRVSGAVVTAILLISLTTEVAGMCQLYIAGICKLGGGKMAKIFPVQCFFAPKAQKGITKG